MLSVVGEVVAGFGADEDNAEVPRFVDTENGSNFCGIYLNDHLDGNTYVPESDLNAGL